MLRSLIKKVIGLVQGDATFSRIFSVTWAELSQYSQSTTSQFQHVTCRLVNSKAFSRCLRPGHLVLFSYLVLNDHVYWAVAWQTLHERFLHDGLEAQMHACTHICVSTDLDSRIAGWSFGELFRTTLLKMYTVFTALKHNWADDEASQMCIQISELCWLMSAVEPIWRLQLGSHWSSVSSPPMSQTCKRYHCVFKSFLFRVTGWLSFFKLLMHCHVVTFIEYWQIL